jgi:hypothetical protein
LAGTEEEDEEYRASSKTKKRLYHHNPIVIVRYATVYQELTKTSLPWNFCTAVNPSMVSASHKNIHDMNIQGIEVSNPLPELSTIRIAGTKRIASKIG